MHVYKTSKNWYAISSTFALPELDPKSLGSNYNWIQVGICPEYFYR